MKPEYLKAIESIDADRKRWMKTELMVDLQITGEMAETLIHEYFGKREPAPTFWIAKSRLDRILSKEISWPHVYTTDQSKHFECVPLFISAETPAPAPHTTGDQHPDDIAVDRFAAAMKAKLAKKRTEGRGGWEDKEDCSQSLLSELLREHVDKGDPVDVGNLAMMLHQRNQRITASDKASLEAIASMTEDQE